MIHEHPQILWDQKLIEDLRALLQLGLQEDLEGNCDLTTDSLVPREAAGTAHVVARESGVVAGLGAGPVLLDVMSSDAKWQPLADDGDHIQAGHRLATWTGPARDLLTGERTLLNVLCHLSGIATSAAKFAEQTKGTKARFYDTRKTLPGWRRLQKYAVSCGGGRNHRRGLDDAVLIKDNHLCFGAKSSQYDLVAAVQRAREFARKTTAQALIQIEIDSLAQLAEVLPAHPDIVLLDNMTVEELKRAVEIRDRADPTIALEASGGIHLATIRAVAESGVERISVGALTHTVAALDLALDWDN